jgi:ABC-type multidrug transport system permease subunit
MSSQQAAALPPPIQLSQQTEKKTLYAEQEDSSFESKTTSTEVIVIILVSIIIFGIYIIIPSILIDYYNRNNITSTSYEYGSYIFAIVTIVLVVVCIVGSFILFILDWPSIWLRVFIYGCLVIYMVATLYFCIIITQKIDDNNLTGNKKINPNFKWLWLVWCITVGLPVYIEYIQHMKD